MVLAAIIPATVQAQTALDRVLALIEADPQLQGVTVVVNFASNAKSGAGGAAGLDSSVTFINGDPAWPASTDTAVGVTADELARVSKNLTLQITTTAIGAMSSGLVSSVNLYGAPTGPGYLMVNGARTAAPLEASVWLNTAAPQTLDSTTATTAVGAMNTGVVQIVVRDGKSVLTPIDPAATE